MCECAPLFYQCEYDGCNAISCKAHCLELALTELYQSIPLIGRLIPDYKCPDFRIKGCGTQE